MKNVKRMLMAGMIVLAPAQGFAGSAGEAGAVFLRLGMGARASGMGEAYVGVAGDATSIYWNPGAMAAALGTHATFMHNEYLQTIRLDQAAITHETEYGTFGVSFTGLYMDEMDRYDDLPSAIPLGKFSAYDVSFSLGYARYVVPNLSAGLAVKVVYENIDEVTAKGWAVDAGIYHVSRIEGVKFAAVITNFGAPIKFESDAGAGDEFDLPRTAKIGASFERDYPGIKGELLATLDLVFPNDGDFRQHIGGEFGYNDLLFLRGGFKAGYDSHGTTFGLGVRYRRTMVDYAYQLIDNDLGDSHRVGFSLDI